MANRIINLGGNLAAGEERIFFRDFEFDLSSGEHIVAKKSFIPGVDMDDLFARHKGRYHLLGLYSRPGYQVLDFPCGSGYATDILKEFDVVYRGMDKDLLVIEYARRVYGRKNVTFEVADLQIPKLPSGIFDTIGCIEGIEHIEQKFQSPLIRAFKEALKPGGTLIVSSPENPIGVSGPSGIHAKWHKWELTKKDFLDLLQEHFDNVELITHKAVLSTGVLTTCFYGICHK
ncbi:MAG: class I SAM-dependent methyltransferase [Parcubacteria group bacterium]|nr:class I SAM-dependent methyltransferase [Parcubacteria group bacterium]